MSLPEQKSTRIASIDVFRAITMFLMIFVNDLWSIQDVPHWLEHAAADEDMLGFSDVIFPAFLFVMGMSIPLAIGGRLKKGESKMNILKHIIIRSFALLVMGLFTVNTEYGVADIAGLGKPVYIIIMLLAFFMIWNIYTKTEDLKKQNLFRGLKIFGWIILVVLALIYRNPQGELFQIRWWGILGLIGLTYLLCATIYLFANRKNVCLLIATLFFIMLCIAGSNHWLGAFSGIIPGDGCFHAFTMCGLMLSLLYNSKNDKASLSKKMTISGIVAILFIVAGFAAHSWWIISKIQATPTWLFFCTGISILAYMCVYWLADIQGKAGWFGLIKPAGTATLTCYLIPYLLYSFFMLINLRWSEFLITGYMGLVKCILFSFLTIGITALLNKGGVKLKI